MSNWLNKWYLSILCRSLVVFSFTSVFASDVTSYLEHSSSPTISSGKSVFQEDARFEHSKVKDTSYGDAALEYLGIVANSGAYLLRSISHVVRKHPLQALTIFLALQKNGSCATLPTASALSISNREQNLTYIPDGSEVSILPMVLSDTNAESIELELALIDSISGNLRSSARILPLPTELLTISAANSILSTLLFKPANGFRNVAIVRVVIAENFPPDLGFATGFRLKIYPFNSSQSSTSDARQPTSYSLTDTSKSLSLSSTAQSPITTTSDGGSSVPATELLYGIVGGAVGGVVFCGSIVVGVVIYLRKKFSSDQHHKTALSLQQPSSGTDEAYPYQSKVNSSYANRSMASARNEDENRYVLRPNDNILSQGSHGASYVNLPVKSHYETSIPPHREKTYAEVFSNLHKAAAEGDCSMLAVFLGFGISVDSKNDEGFTPLHLAAKAGKGEACAFLLQRGADKNILTKEGKTALVVAQDHGYTDLIVLLR